MKHIAFALLALLLPAAVVQAQTPAEVIDQAIGKSPPADLRHGDPHQVEA